MPKLLFVSLTAIVAVALFAACGDDDEGSDDSDPTASTEMLVLVTPIDEFEVSPIDAGDSGPSPGDVRAFVSPVYEEDDGEIDDQLFGRIDGTTTQTAIEEEDGQEIDYRQSLLQLTTDDGTMIAAGLYIAPVGEVLPAGGVTRPIVGGTGEYFGAVGELTVTATDGGDLRYEYRYGTPD